MRNACFDTNKTDRNIIVRDGEENILNTNMSSGGKKKVLNEE